MFLHDVVLEAIVCGDTEVLIENLASEIEKMNQNKCGKPCNFETQFSLLSKVTPNPDDVVSIIACEHGDKNRSGNYLPGIINSYSITLFKVYMLADRYLVPSSEENEYIHATFIDVRFESWQMN